MRTSWVNSHAAHEDALKPSFERSPGIDPATNFWSPSVRFKTWWPDMACNNLSMVVLKVAAPGIPDCYQGTELGTHAC